MGKFKVGDRIHINSASSGAYGANGRDGVVTDKPSVAGCSGQGLHVEIDGRVWALGTSDELDIQIIGGTMKLGDILENKYGSKKKVLAYLNQGVEVMLLSLADEFDRTEEWFTPSELEEDGWKVVDDTQVEKSVAEIEKDLKLAPGTLRIKKED